MNAQMIKEHMEVLGSDGAHVGTVDCMKGADKIVLTMLRSNIESKAKAAEGTFGQP